MAKLKFKDDAESRHPTNVGCSVKHLDRKSLIGAAKTASSIYPGNRPNMRGLSRIISGDALSEVMKPQAIAILTTKYWGTNGVNLTVSFVEPTTQQLADLIISHMNSWQQFANVTFTYVKSGGDVRISRGPGGYWSYLGTDIESIPKNQQTMNLEGFTLKTPLSEYKRVVRHETGHTLGFPHEHMRKDIVKLLDPAKTISYFEQTQGWSESEIEDQVLTPLDEASLMGTPVDINSIMCYQLPGSITISGQAIPGGLDIDDSDAAFAAKIYPKGGTTANPPPAPPPTNGGGGGSNATGLVTIDPVKKIVTIPTGWITKIGS